MNSKFVTPLIFSSALTLGALSFVACGEDSTPTGFQGPTGSSSSTAPWIPPEITPETAIIFGQIGVASETTTRVKFQGSVSLDLGDSNTVADVNAAVITGIDLAIVKKGTQEQQGVATFVNQIVYPTASTINFLEAGLQTDLTTGYTDCGEFELIIVAYADDGIIQTNAMTTIPFTRSEENCKEPESSSSAPPDVPGAPLKSFSVSVSTKLNKCINIATETVTTEPAGDICFESTATGTVNLSSTTGLKFTVYDNKNDSDRKNDFGKNYMPEKRKNADGTIYPPVTADGTAHQTTTDDFLYVEGSLSDTYTNFMNEDDKFFVALGPDFVPYSGSATGFYAFIVTKRESPDANGDVEFSMTIYKAL
jgi:hypothetical protein